MTLIQLETLFENMDFKNIESCQLNDLAGLLFEDEIPRSQEELQVLEQQISSVSRYESEMASRLEMEEEKRQLDERLAALRRYHGWTVDHWRLKEGYKK